MFWSMTALAAPVFVSDEPGLPELATAAWNAAAACTGREARAYAKVVLDPGPERAGFGGRARTAGPRWRTWTADDGSEIRRETIDEGGMYYIRLANTRSDTIAHEVAHAWVHNGPPALVEGATDLLADCVAERDPKVFDHVK